MPKEIAEDYQKDVLILKKSKYIKKYFKEV